jgi:hypothetical protein
LVGDFVTADEAQQTRRFESQFTEIAENQPELLARHCTEAGLIEKASGLWGQTTHSRTRAKSIKLLL